MALIQHRPSSSSPGDIFSEILRKNYRMAANVQNTPAPKKIVLKPTPTPPKNTKKK